MVLLLATSCQADLGTRTAPAAAPGQSIVAGRYTGLVRTGADGSDRALTIEAHDCGAVLTGTIALDGDDTATLQGHVDGTSVTLTYAHGGTTGTLQGTIVDFDTMVGVWSDDAGAGGTWVAVRHPGSEEEFPCDDVPIPDDAR